MRNFFRLIFKREASMVGAAILGLICLLAVLAPFIAPYDPYGIDTSRRLEPPSGKHLFGTDCFGRDIFSRVLFGARLSLLTGASIALISTSVGVVIGAISGSCRGFGSLAMRLMDCLMAFPDIILALALLAIIGHASLLNVIISLAIVYSPRMARTVYGLTLRVIEFDYIDAAKAVGCSYGRILVRYIIPNLLSPVIVQSTFTCALAILGAAALDFLGVGVPPYVPSWGAMINEGRTYVVRAPWIMVFPGMFIVLFVLALNILGDTLRDALDPRLRRLI